MFQQPVIARVQPEKIKAKETYTLHTNYGVGLPPPGENSGSGKIEMKLPFDGKTSVNKTTLKDLRKQMRLEPVPEQSEARIGHLGFHDYGGSDLDELYGLSLQHDLLPMYLPLTGDALPTVDDLTADMVEQSATALYTPAPITKSPIRFESISVSDEHDYISEQTQPEFEQFLKRWSRNRSKLGSFRTSLNLSFVLAFDVPRFLQPALAEERPILTDMCLTWPVPAAVSDIQVLLDPPASPTADFGFADHGEPRDVKYDPRQRQLRWGNIPFVATQKEDGSYKFVTPKIQLAAYKLGELHQQNQLCGELKVKLPLLYSGLKLSYFDAVGRQVEDAPIEYETEMNVKFQFNLLALWQQKVYSPYQVIKFPRVILNRQRVNDLVTILRAKRFVITADMTAFPDNAVGDRPISFVVGARRQEGDSQLTLVVELVGHPSVTTREKEIPEGEKFKSTFSTGETTCHLHGRITNDLQLVMRELTDIHMRLKERFRHVSILD